jgi:predicted transcriptional regulator
MAESGNPRRTKLDWFKAIRGADLNSAEIHILALLVGYSNAQGENAHPGVTRLANDSGLSKRQVQYILRSLEAKRVIVVTQDGGNQTFKGAATVYRIMTMPRRPKDATDCTLDSDKGGKSDTKGAKSRTGRVQPIAPHQVIHQVLKEHQSDSSESASLAAQARARANGFESDDIDLISVEDALEEELGLDQQEMNLVDAMLQRGAHLNAVRNTINKQRLGGWTEPQSQKRLDEEEPRCQVQTCRQPKSKHAQWMAMLDETDRHEFAP